VACFFATIPENCCKGKNVLIVLKEQPDKVLFPKLEVIKAVV
jgi:hypothetical protein